jgi:voltage-gated potassium channel
MLVMLFGIGTLALMVGRVAEKVYEARRRSMKGEMRLKLSGHIAILGYRPGETEQLVEEILADKVCQERDIVLCANSVDENPMPDNVKFVKGEITSEETLARACVVDAWRIVVHGREDSQTITGVLAALSVNRTAHIVAIINDPTNEVHVRRIDPRVECVLPVQVALTVQALQDPGATKVIHPLLSNKRGDVLFKIDIPETAGP